MNSKSIDILALSPADIEKANRVLESAISSAAQALRVSNESGLRDFEIYIQTRMKQDARDIAESIIQRWRAEAEAEKSAPGMSEEDFQRLLLKEGIISEIPRPLSSRTKREDFQPIEVLGKPLSEIIIEDRR